MKQSSPAARDRAQRRVRSITIASAAGAGVLALGGAAAAAGTFGGRTVSASESPASPTVAPTLDPGTGLQPPTQPPTDGGANVPPQAPVVTGGS